MITVAPVALAPAMSETSSEDCSSGNPSSSNPSSSNPSSSNPSSSNTVPLASADRIHAYLVDAFRIGNRARLRFARLLAALAESRMYLQLGHPGITQYAEQRFGVHRSETYEMLRIAEIIDERPACRDAFEDGRLSWSALKLITRVASSETETEWLEFAAARSFTEIRVEVQDAVKKNRSRPRAGRYGLPNLTVKLTLELTREEQVRLETALEKAGAEIAPAIGDGPLETKDVLLYLAERFLRTDPEGTPAGRSERNDSPYTIVYHRCEDCRRARLVTADGPVEVAPDRMERLAGDANEVRLNKNNEPGDSDAATPIDRPNPPALARRVKLRDGGRCRNPGCRHRENLQAHHIEHRANGGRTVAANEIAVCRTCHALLHAGLLDVTVNVDGGLTWRPRSDTLDVSAAPEAAALAEIPVVQVQSATADGRVEGSVDLEGLSGALVRLGLSGSEARARLIHAHGELRRRGADAGDEEKLLTLALSAR